MPVQSLLRKKKVISKKPIKKFTRFRPMILSRHPSHNHLRTGLSLLPFRSVIRLGSTTVPKDGKERLQINTVQAIKNSASKLLMKQCFTKAGVKTADCWTYCSQINGSDQYRLCFNKMQFTDKDLAPTHARELPYPIVAKHIYGSRGTGNTLLNTQEELQQWMRGKDLSNYIFEKFYNFNREYRLHVTKNGCFYTCRKVLREDTPENKRWYRNDSNSNWLVETNPSFDKPVNWDNIVAECVKALNAVGLDIGGFDVKVQSAKTPKGKVRENPEFIIIESNSACSHGEVTAQKYVEELNKLLIYKKNNG